MSDVSRERQRFVCRFKIRITPKELAPDNPDRPRLSKEPPGGGVSLPKIHEIMRPQWPQNKFTEHSGLKFGGGLDDEPLEAYVNMENLYVTNELARAKDDADRVLIRHYYMNACDQEAKRNKPVGGNGDEPAKKAEDLLADDLATIFRLSGGVAAVIIPVVRNLAAAAAKIAG